MGLSWGRRPGSWDFRGRLRIPSAPGRQKKMNTGKGYYLPVIGTHDLLKVTKYCSWIQTISFYRLCVIFFLKTVHKVLNNFNNNYGNDNSYCFLNVLYVPGTLHSILHIISHLIFPFTHLIDEEKILQLRNLK